MTRMVVSRVGVAAGVVPDDAQAATTRVATTIDGLMTPPGRGTRCLLLPIGADLCPGNHGHSSVSAPTGRSGIAAGIAPRRRGDTNRMAPGDKTDTWFRVRGATSDRGACPGPAGRRHR